jgi:Raf kinase inhibitor-like YbhB/YbcL family protein
VNLQCPALQAGAFIPSRYAFRGIPGGQNISLPLRWSGVPAGTRSCLLAIVDRHPVANNWLHWCLVNIPAGLDHLAEGISRGALLPEGSLELTNSFGEQGYGGPKPPRGSGPHQYVVTLYALSVDRLPVSSTTRFSEVMQMAQSSLLATASTTGIFEQ